MTNRHVKSPFWTPEQDALLQKLPAARLSIDKIAKRLGVTSTAVQHRSYHLRLEFRSYGLRAARNSCVHKWVADLLTPSRAGQH
jgi:hypothetical protein